MSGYIQKSRIPVKRPTELPPVVLTHYIEAKNQIKERGAEAGGPFANEQGRHDWEGSPLPKAGQGCAYRKFRAGAAREGDSSAGGTRRFVFEIHISSGKFLEAYYTPDHYEKGSFIRLLV